MSGDLLRSWTNPVTNLAALTIVDARSQLARLAIGEMPHRTWPTFVHELTHHWCFTAPIGQALTYLYLRPMLAYLEAHDQQRGAVDEDTEEEIRFSAGLDFVTYDMTLGLLWPFLEGVAQFAEFDLVPNPDGETYSFPLQWTLLLFALQSAEGEVGERSSVSPHDLDMALFEYLLRARGSELLIDRKAGVLALPLTKSLTKQPQHYLASYLLVKNLWVSLALRDQRLWNADLFLGFLYRYLFCDMAMVATLLEPDDKRTDRYQNVANYFNQSLTRLANDDLGDVIGDVVDYISTPVGSLSGELYTRWSSLDQQRAAMEAAPITSSNHAMWERGIELSLAEMASLDKKASASDRYRNLNNALMWMITQRDAFCVIDQRVRIRVTQARRLVAMLDGSPLYSAPATDEFALPPGEYDGTVNGYVMPLLSATFVALAIDGRIGAIDFSRDLPEPFPSQLPRYRMDAAELLKGLQELRAVSREWVVSDSLLDVIVPAVEESITRWHEQVAAEQALPHVPAARRKEVVGLLDEGGFAKVVPASRLRGLTTITLLASLPISRSSASELFDNLRDIHRCPESYDELVELVRQRGRELLNDELLFDTEQGLFSAV